MVSTTPTSDPRWQRADSAGWLWSTWDDQHVLFHRPSGKTHFLNAAAVFLLEEVLGEPSTISAATETLATARNVTADNELRDDVTEMLLRLEELGLIESA